MLNGSAEGTEPAGEGASAQALEWKTPALFSIFLHHLVLCTHTCEAMTGVPFWLSDVLRSTAKKRNGHRKKGSLTLAWSDLASQIWLTSPSLTKQGSGTPPASFRFLQDRHTPPRPPVSRQQAARTLADGQTSLVPTCSQGCSKASSIFKRLVGSTTRNF